MSRLAERAATIGTGVFGAIAVVVGVGALFQGEPLVALILITFGLALFAGNRATRPPRWDGEPETGTELVGKVPTPAVVFSVDRDRMLALAVLAALFALLGMWIGLLALADSMTGVVIGAAVWSAFFAWVIWATVRRLRRRRLLVLTTDLIRVQSPAGSADLRWEDVVEAGLRPIGDQLYVVFRLREEARAKVSRSRTLGRLNRRFGADVYLPATWLRCEPEFVVLLFEQYRLDPRLRRRIGREV
ncbi:STM3941 family protein [Thermomonospora cellulosilytica]|uniref:Uncharacterized protein n=1 Tax=Thermomonospora cellulosilytica TaxID=1411118 RepID=A0A7W3MTW2_9ACTN|nr:STM3941 family protein [Thermomonospora cellulosilytica]MBA9001773.1 hypothetical protein [Thermomonospora cellulosilytica]